MLANYLVLMNERLADTVNFPQPKFKDIVRDSAMFFWRKSALDYQKHLINHLTPSNFHIEMRKI